MDDLRNDPDYWKRNGWERLRDMTEHEKALRALHQAQGAQNCYKATVRLGETMLDTRYPLGDPRRWEAHLPIWKKVLNRISRAISRAIGVR